MAVRELVARNGDTPGGGSSGAAPATAAAVMDTEDLMGRRGFGKAPPPVRAALVYSWVSSGLDRIRGFMYSTA